MKRRRRQFWEKKKHVGEVKAQFSISSILKSFRKIL
jgi:hypothetical protein